MAVAVVRLEGARLHTRRSQARRQCKSCVHVSTHRSATVPGARASGQRFGASPRRHELGHRLVALRSTTVNSSFDDGEQSPAAAVIGTSLKQVVAGLTTTLSMIPESLAFTFIAGVPPIVGLQTAATLAFVCSLLGSQAGIISGAAGATAVVYAPLVAIHGIEYLFAAVIASGAIQVAAGAARLGKFIRLVPQPCMMGFVNGLAIVIGMSQLEQFKIDGAWMSGLDLYTMLGLVAATMLIIKLFPKVTKAIPGPLAAILTLTVGTQLSGIKTKTVGDLASVAGEIPSFHIPAVPFSYETLSIIAPYALSVAAVGLIETLLTQQLVDQITETRTETHVECISQGLGNLVSGLLGGMGGCAMIGQSMINVNSGGRTKLAGCSCAAFLALSVVAGSSVIERIPLAALVGTMWMLVIDIFDKSTFNRWFKVPKTDNFVVFLVTIVTVFTNLALAVFAGVVVSSLNFAWKSARRISVTRTVEPTAYKTKAAAVYSFTGPLFFGSVTRFRGFFNPREEDESVIVLDFMGSRVYDASALEAIQAVAEQFQIQGKEVHLRHLSKDCQKLLDRAADLVEVNSILDPSYGVAVDYD